MAKVKCNSPYEFSEAVKIFLNDLSLRDMIKPWYVRCGKNLLAGIPSLNFLSAAEERPATWAVGGAGANQLENHVSP